MTEYVYEHRDDIDTIFRRVFNREMTDLDFIYFIESISMILLNLLIVDISSECTRRELVSHFKRNKYVYEN